MGNAISKVTNKIIEKQGKPKTNETTKKNDTKHQIFKKLPNLDLPTFDGDSTKWPNFLVYLQGSDSRGSRVH
jgi:hypothetical protein